MQNEFCLVARCLVPTDAHLICGCLKAAGVAAVVADDQLMQVHSLLGIAIGGARVLVPSEDLGLAREIIAAFQRGELALDDDADVGGENVYEFRPRR